MEMKSFISYPREREPIAREISGELKGVGIDVFLDVESLLVGIEWKRELAENIRSSDFVILICSKETTTKTGELQNEIRLILECANLRPRGQTFLLPIRVGGAKMPTEIAHYQYIDYEQKDWLRSLLRSVDTIAKRLGNDRVEKGIRQRIGKIEGDLPYSKIEISEKKKKYNLSIDYIRYTAADMYQEYINGAILSEVMDHYFSFKRNIVDWDSTISGKSDLFCSATEFFNRDGIVSINISYYDYWSGAAHGNHWRKTMNFGGEDCGRFDIDDLFSIDESDASKIIKRSDDIIRANSAPLLDEDSESGLDLSSQVNEEYNTALSMLSNFNIDDRGVTLNFGGATGLPYAFGEVDVMIPWSAWNFEITDSFKKIRMAKFIEKLRASR
jgi:hypothetical protein